jgi:uncharacterized protein (TIGR03067 family)
MRKQAAVIVLALLAPVLAAEEKKSDEDKIQGTWKALSGEHGGKKAPEEALKGFRMTFAAGGKLTVLAHGNTEEGTFKLDATKKPKQIDLTTEDKSLKGIYELDGDTLKLCVDEEGSRPTEFKSPEGTKVYLVVLQREKK